VIVIEDNQDTPVETNKINKTKSKTVSTTNSAKAKTTKKTAEKSNKKPATKKTTRKTSTAKPKGRGIRLKPMPPIASKKENDKKDN
jgi:hypothetical protein